MSDESRLSGLPLRVPHARHLAKGAMIVGLCMLIVSFVWPARPGSWTKQQQQALSTAGSEVQKIIHGSAKASVPSAEGDRQRAAPLRAAQARFARLEAELEAARRGNRTVQRVLFWTGLALMIGGLALSRSGDNEIQSRSGDNEIQSRSGDNEIQSRSGDNDS